MTLSKQTLIAILASLLLVVGAAFSAKYWLSPNPAPTLFAPLNATCNLHVAPCASDIPGGGRIELSIEPRPIPVLQPLRLVVKTEGLDARVVDVVFSGVAMQMGDNRTRLKQEGGNRFTGQSMLPVCISGSMEWQASVEATTGKMKAVAPFRFTTSRN